MTNIKGSSLRSDSKEVANIVSAAPSGFLSQLLKLAPKIRVTSDAASEAEGGNYAHSEAIG